MVLLVHDLEMRGRKLHLIHNYGALGAGARGVPDHRFVFVLFSDSVLHKGIRLSSVIVFVSPCIVLEIK